ncbi:MAG TPA: hypothetical protein VGM91_11030 [Conexibacter sp.]
MSGLFQRIARRRGDVQDDASAAPIADQSATPVAADAPATVQAPKRFVGAAADEQAGEREASPSQPSNGATHADASQPANGEAGEPASGATQAFSLGDQPTALFPLVPEQPTAAGQPADTEAGQTGWMPVSAADTGAHPLSIGGLAASDADAEADAEADAADATTPPTGESAVGGAPTGEAAVGGPPTGETTVGTTPPGETATPDSGQARTGDVATQAPALPAERRPGFRERGKMRRRLRYLRRVRELQVRDLGGLAFDLRRYERKRDDLVAQKIDQIRASDDELRALEQALDERRDVRDVRAPGIGGACPRCFSIYGSNDRFCAHCGAALGGLAQGPAQVVPPAPPPASHQ